MNQTQVAIKAKISQGYLNEIIHGTKTPRWEVAKRVAEATRTNPVLWLDGTPEERRAAIEALKDRAA